MNKIPESELILNPDGSIYHLNLQADQVADTIIFVGDPDRVPKVSKHFDRIDTKVSKREFVTHTGELQGKRLSVISTGIGTDNIDIVLTELDALVNIDLKNRTIKEEKTSLEIVRIGTSGSLQKDIPVDSLVASSHGLGLEGLMHYYDFSNDANETLIFLELMRSVKEDFGFPLRPYLITGNEELRKRLAPDFLSGITATCSGFYGPQGRNLRLKASQEHLLTGLGEFRYNDLRITNFEMETAGIYGLAKLLGHKALSLNAILANRVEQTFSKDPKGLVEGLIEMTLDRLTKE